MYRSIWMIIFLMVAVIAAPVAAMAGVEMGGEMSVSGVWIKDHDFRKDVLTAGTSGRWWEQAAALSLTADVDNVKAYITMTVRDDGDAWGTIKSWNVGLADDDVAYLEIPVGNSLTVYAGRVLNDWGHGFWWQGAGVDEFKLSAKLSENLTIGLYTDKVEEAGRPDLRADHDDYGLPIEYSTEGFTIGLLPVLTNHDAYTDYDDPAQPYYARQKGMSYDAYFTISSEKVKVIGEFALADGKMFEVVDSDMDGNPEQHNKPFGAFVQAEIDLDPMSVTAAAAYAKNAFTADDQFNPTLMFGTDQSTAIADFGASTQDYAYLVALGASMPMSDAVSAGVKGAYALLSSRNATKAWELDATMDVKLAKSATWSFGVAYLKPIGVKEGDPYLDTDTVMDAGITRDAAISAIQTISFEF